MENWMVYVCDSVGEWVRQNIKVPLNGAVCSLVQMNELSPDCLECLSTLIDLGFRRGGKARTIGPLYQCQEETEHLENADVIFSL